MSYAWASGLSKAPNLERSCRPPVLVRAQLQRPHPRTWIPPKKEAAKGIGASPEACEHRRLEPALEAWGITPSRRAMEISAVGGLVSTSIPIFDLVMKRVALYPTAQPPRNTVNCRSVSLVHVTVSSPLERPRNHPVSRETQIRCERCRRSRAVSLDTAGCPHRRCRYADGFPSRARGGYLPGASLLKYRQRQSGGRLP